MGMTGRLLLMMAAAMPCLVRAGRQVDGVASCMRGLEAVEAMLDSFPRERVYVHLDNTPYYKGEHIWYKAYVVDEASLRETCMSKILYVDLVNPMGYPIATQRLAIEDGQAHGSFLLSDTLNAGFYEVRAYTSWMLNFTPGYHHAWLSLSERDVRDAYGEGYQQYLKGNAGVFSRVLPVYDKPRDNNYTMKTMTVPPKVTSSLSGHDGERLVADFYPEGGNMVRGVPTKVAFQVHTSEGQYVNAQVELLGGGKPLGQFPTVYSGMGMLAFVPDSTDDTRRDRWRCG